MSEQSGNGTDRCVVCDEPLDGETTLVGSGEAHAECADLDPHADVLPDGGTVEDGTDREPIQQRGVYLMADTPLTAHPLAVEDGSGDKQLLAEVIAEELTDDEVDSLINRLISYRVDEDPHGTAIECEDCGHLRQTTERYPTLVNCEECGSYNLRYVQPDTE